ncbi:MAG: DUF87 domain-containing protein [Deltaproteobacteria bacterium]|nr:DUF87 domain-containing protein [Deltaproteobacteria bacterium]
MGFVASHFKSGREYVAVAGLRLRELLAEVLFRETAGLEPDAAAVSNACRERCVDFANALAAMPDPREFFLVHLPRPADETGFRRLDVALLSVGRGKTAAEAERLAQTGACNISLVLQTTLDFAFWEPLEGPESRQPYIDAIRPKFCVELRRRMEKVTVAHGHLEREPFGFTTEPGTSQVRPVRGKAEFHLLHLFPWVPSDDPWRRVADVLLRSEPRTTLVVHGRGFDRAPDQALAVARENFAAAEKTLSPAFGGSEKVDSVFELQAGALRDWALRRLALLEARTLAVRVFLCSDARPSDAAVATVLSAIDDASIRTGQPGADCLFRGGADVEARPPEETVEPLLNPTMDLLFGPMEVAAVVRTVCPRGSDFPGIATSRSRTALMTGSAGGDAPLGTNLHLGQQGYVALDAEARFRHVYVVGQTGTGKSTLLLNMVLHDIRKGRGVALLDPHGSLIDDLLERLPAERSKDVVLVDPADAERPVGFNPLFIDEEDPMRYRRMRDLVIDDMYGFIDHIYDLRQTGGPIFEVHFRSMLGLLMGAEPPKSRSEIPNLMVFRSLYTNQKLRARLKERLGDSDPVLTEFVKEAEATGGEASLNNLSTYITSKFSRFVSDTALRNIICQPRMLDLDSIIAEGKILLFNLGKGRFGEKAAALLSSQIVSRIWHAVTRRGAGNGRPFFLYADEFQLFADERFAEMLAEARKFGLALTVAHQYVEQLRPEVLRAVLGNVGTSVVLRVGSRDAELLAPLFEPTFNRHDLSGVDNFHAYVRSAGCVGSQPFSLAVAPPPPAGDRKLAERIRSAARKTYGTERDEAEFEILSTYWKFMGKKGTGDEE